MAKMRSKLKELTLSNESLSQAKDDYEAILASKNKENARLAD
jgi:hypothetical protein